MTTAPEAGKMTPSEQAAKTAQQVAAKILLDWNEATIPAEDVSPIPHRAVLNLVGLIESALIDAHRRGQEDMRERAASIAGAKHRALADTERAHWRLTFSPFLIEDFGFNREVVTWSRDAEHAIRSLPVEDAK